MSKQAAAVVDIEDDVASEKRLYEIAVLYPTTLSQKEEKDLQSSIEALLEEDEGEQVAKDMWGKRGLAFPIAGSKEGNFIIYHYNVHPERLKEIDKELRILTGVSRHLIVKPPKNYVIEKYSEKFTQWLEDREKVEEEKEKEKEEAFKEKVLKKAKREAERVEKKMEEKKVEKKVPVEKDELDSEIDKLISDDDLGL